MPFQEKRETETRFIPARVTDNRWNNPEYVRVLENLTGWQKRAWLDGDWDIAAGQYFTTLRREVHVIADFDETRAVEWFAALDYGFAHYTVVLLGCRDGDGNIFIVDEHAERLWLPQRHAGAVKTMLARHKIGERKLGLDDLKRFVAGADVFSRQSDGTTIAAQYAKLGISLRGANTDRVNGWAEILQRFGDVEAGIRPTLFIHKRCGRLLETLPALQHDPNRPEDVLKIDADEDGIGGDDAADSLRYLVATKARTITQRKLRGFEACPGSSCERPLGELWNEHGIRPFPRATVESRGRRPLARSGARSTRKSGRAKRPPKGVSPKILRPARWRRAHVSAGQSSSGIITVMAGCGSSMSSAPQVAMSLTSRAARLSLRT